MTISGWLFDAYPSKDKMVFWIKTPNGSCIRLEDDWTHSIYVASDNRTELEKKLTTNPAILNYIKNFAFVQRLERITDHEKNQVLKLTLTDSREAIALGNTIEDMNYDDKFRLYNVDVLPQQAYFYEHDLFPLAKCRVEVKGNGDRRLSWEVNDDLESTDYELPDFKVANIDVTLRQEGRLPQFTDKIDTISLIVGQIIGSILSLIWQFECYFLATLLEILPLPFSFLCASAARAKQKIRRRREEGQYRLFTALLLCLSSRDEFRRDSHMSLPFQT